MTCVRCRQSAMSSTMAWILSTVSMQKFLIRSLWAFRCCLAVKTARQYAPITDSNRPTITPQKNSLVRTVVRCIRTVVRCEDCGSTINPKILPSRQITRTATSNVITIQNPTLGNLPNFSDIGSRTTLSWLVALFLADQQNECSGSYQHCNQNTDDERNNRMPSRLDLLRSSA